MEFNANKFEVIKYGVNDDLKNQYEYLTPEYDSFIECKSCVKDLGVMMNDLGDFDDQIKKVIMKVK